MILTCDRKIINIYFRIVIIEVVIQPIITTIVLVVFTTITPTLFLYVIFYLRWIHECDDVLIELSKTIPTYSSTTIIITTCMGSFFSHSQRNFFSYDYIMDVYFTYIGHVTAFQSNVNIDSVLYSNHLLYRNECILK